MDVGHWGTHHFEFALGQASQSLRRRMPSGHGGRGRGGHTCAQIASRCAAGLGKVLADWLPQSSLPGVPAAAVARARKHLTELLWVLGRASWELQSVLAGGTTMEAEPRSLPWPSVRSSCVVPCGLAVLQVVIAGRSAGAASHGHSGPVGGPRLRLESLSGPACAFAWTLEDLTQRYVRVATSEARVLLGSRTDEAPPWLAPVRELLPLPLRKFT